MNDVTMTGRIGRDVETKYFASGNCLSEFSMAIYTGKDKKAHWQTVKVWGEINDQLRSELTKGAKVTVGGRFDRESWTDKTTGQEVSKLSLIADPDYIDFAGTNDAAIPASPSANVAARVAAAKTTAPPSYDDF